MASLMDDIMRQYYSGSTGGSGSAPSNPMMSANIGQVLAPSPTTQPFTPSTFGALVNPRTRMGSYIEPAPVSAFMGGLPSQLQPTMPMGEPGYSGAAGAMMPASPFRNPMMMNTEPGYSAAAGAMVPTAAEAARPALPGRTPGFLDQLLSGPDYQSNNMPVDIRAQGPSMPGQEMPIQSINWGDAQNPADFFRADQLAMQNPNIPGFLGGY
jgi:hypothetical protein